MMRKQWIQILLFVAGAWWVFSPSVVAQQTPKVEALVQDLAGSLDAYRESAGQWAKAEKGDRYVERDALSTGANSWAQLLFHDEHQLRMKENTEMSIRQLYKRADTGDEGTEIQLDRGEILNRVRQLPTEGSIYTIHTPTATSSVRGTRFLVKVYQVEGRWVTEVKVLDGLVEIVDRAGKVLNVLDNQEAAVDELGAPGAAEAMSKDSAQSLESEFESLTLEETGALDKDLENLADQMEKDIGTDIIDRAEEINKPVEADTDDDTDDDLFNTR